ncbi:hypothetical protein CTA2_1810, partial [Colletotrichum tanaceti]
MWFAPCHLPPPCAPRTRYDLVCVGELRVALLFRGKKFICFKSPLSFLLLRSMHASRALRAPSPFFPLLNPLQEGSQSNLCLFDRIDSNLDANPTHRLKRHQPPSPWVSSPPACRARPGRPLPSASSSRSEVCCSDMTPALSTASS